MAVSTSPYIFNRDLIGIQYGFCKLSHQVLEVHILFACESVEQKEETEAWGRILIYEIQIRNTLIIGSD